MNKLPVKGIHLVFCWNCFFGFSNDDNVATFLEEKIGSKN